MKSEGGAISMRRLLCGIAVLLSLTTSHASAIQAAFTVSVPEGFEAFLEPQTTMVDVYYGGRFVREALVTYTPTSIEFDDPASVVDALPDVIGKPSLTNHLTGPLAPNSDRVCVREGQTLCGLLEPDFIDIIFDERRFRVDIFVHPDLRAPPAEKSASYLPAPDDTGVTFVQSLSTSFSGNSTGQNASATIGRTRLGMGRTHAFSDWANRSDYGTSFDELGVHHDLKDHQVRAGLFIPEVDQLKGLRQTPMAGIHVARSLYARTDIKNVIASDMEVFLASRSLVDLYKDGRLYDTRFYEAGNQRIDTTRLPSGAYNVELRITNSAGVTRSINRFFIKSLILVPEEHDLWFVDLGRLQTRALDDTFPADGGATLLRGGYKHRFTSNLGLGLAGALSKEDFLIESSATWLSEDLFMTGEFFASTLGGAGYGLYASYRYWDTEVAAAMRRTWQSRSNEDYQMLDTDLMQRSLNLTREVGPGRASVSYRESAQAGSASHGTSLQYTWQMSYSWLERINVTAELSKIDGITRSSLAFEVSEFRRYWNHSAQLRVVSSDDDASAQGLAFYGLSTWQDKELYQDDIRVSLRADADENTKSYGLSGEHRSQFATARAATTQTSANGNSNTLTSASLDTTIASHGREVALGGPTPNEAAVIIDLDGAEGSRFDVILNGQREFTARGGQRAVLNLAPYQTYRISIRDLGTDFVRFDNKPQEVTVYPGQTHLLRWTLDKIIIVAGILMGEDPNCVEGEDCSLIPLGDMIIDGTEGITISDPDGYFQGEILESTRSLEINRDDLQCVANLPSKAPSRGVIVYDRIICR